MSRTRGTSLLIWAALASAAVGHSVMSADYVWWEGEVAAEHNFDNRGFAPASLGKPEELSGGNWLSNAGRRGDSEVFARWRVNVPQGGE